MDVGLIVSDLIVTGYKRGAYKVWIPKKHWTPDREDWNIFANNLDDLKSWELDLAKESAIPCWPTGPLTAGGAMPYDDETGIASTDENNPEIKNSTTVDISNGTIRKGANYSAEGSGAQFQYNQSYGGAALSQMYVLATDSGFTTNTRDRGPKGNINKLNYNTKVIVSGNFITGQLPDTQNDWINQLRPLNEDP